MKNFIDSAIICKGKFGYPHEPSQEAKELFEMFPDRGKLPFSEDNVQEGKVIEADKWRAIVQYRNKALGNDWRTSHPFTLSNEPYFREPGEDLRVVYELI